MNMNLLFTRHFFSCMLALLFLGACTKNYLVVDIGSESNKEGGTSDNSNTNPTKDDILVTFNASVESRNVTRSMSPMLAGVENRLYAYLADTGGNIDSSPAATGNYITSSPGILTGTDGYKMYLNNNVYSFYAVSGNATTPPPTFSNGVSEPLSNGVDYLWWRAVQQDVASSQVNIPIVYQHAATQVVFSIAEGTNIKLNKVLSASITTPQPGATMNLFTGVIPPETRYWKAAQIGINHFTAQYIMLPVRSASPMMLIMEVLINDEKASRTYIAELSLPDGELAAGNSYLFKVVINENTVSFPTVSIKEWTEVDESGKPLYPEQA